MSPFVIRREYGQLIEGYNAADAELKAILARPSLSASDRERADMLLRERDEWREVMARCPMFVGEVMRHG